MSPFLYEVHSVNAITPRIIPKLSQTWDWERGSPDVFTPRMLFALNTSTRSGLKATSVTQTLEISIYNLHDIRVILVV